MRKRTKAREAVLKILYQAEITRRDIPTAGEMYWSNSQTKDKAVIEFAHRIANGIAQHVEAIDQYIIQYATNWQIKRMAIIDRNILRLGVYELMFTEDIPPKVSINEAVELAKKYGDTESSKFVNGILDRIHKEETKPKENA